MLLLLLKQSTVGLMNFNVDINFTNAVDNTLVTNRVGSTEKARKDLNFIESTTIQEGLLKTIQWKFGQDLK
jgi:hypothetical protein